MPNKANAKKSLRQIAKRTVRNANAKAELKSLRVQLRKQLTAKKLEDAEKTAHLLSKKLDKAVARGILKLNTASRYKSRLMARLNAAKKA